MAKSLIEQTLWFGKQINKLKERWISFFLIFLFKKKNKKKKIIIIISNSPSKVNFNILIFILRNFKKQKQQHSLIEMSFSFWYK